MVESISNVTYQNRNDVPFQIKVTGAENVPRDAKYWAFLFRVAEVGGERPRPPHFPCTPEKGVLSQSRGS